MKDTRFNFYEQYLKSFQKLRHTLIYAPIMQPPDWSLPFKIMCDTSYYAVEAVLGKQKDKKMQTIYYASENLDKTYLNYATIKKELLAIVYAIDTLFLT